MNLGRESLAAVVLALGYALAGGLYWWLLNVPESNALALILSATLVLLLVVASAVTTAGAVAVASGTGRPARQHVGAAIVGFAIGLALFEVLFAITDQGEQWWIRHSGEIDALFLRYGGITRTGWLHTTVEQTVIFGRLMLGLSAVAALVVAGVSGGWRALLHGLRRSVRLVPLAATLAGVLVFVKIVCRLVFWRPRGLPPTWMEPTFVTIKLATLYAVTIAVAAFVLSVHRRHATSSPPAARS